MSNLRFLPPIGENKVNILQTPLERSDKVKSKTSSEVKGIFDTMMEFLRKSFGEMIGEKLTKVKFGKGEKLLLDNKKNELRDKGDIEIIKVGNASNEIELESVSIRPKGEKNPEKVMLVFLGMGDCYEKHLDSMKQLAEDAGVRIVAFNYRGVGESGKGKTANSAQDLIDDGIAMVNFLKDVERITADDLMIYGHSMGGGVAAEVYKNVEHTGPFISESSFSTFTSAVTSKKGAFAGWLFEKLNWNFNSIGMLEQLGDKNKFGIIANRRDPTIPYEKSGILKQAKKLGLAEIRVIKIGKKNIKETAEASVASKVMISKVKEVEAGGKKKGSKITANSQTSDYTDKFNRIKENNLVSKLRHPHQLIMDQNKDEMSVELSPKMKKELETLKEAADADQLNYINKGIHSQKAKYKNLESAKNGLNEFIIQRSLKGQKSKEVTKELEKLREGMNNLKSVKAYEAKKELYGDVIALNKKYAQEDKLAYAGLVGMIQDLLDVKPASNTEDREII